MSRISDDLWELPVDGVRLSGATFGAQFDNRPTLVSFLRHFG